MKTADYHFLSLLIPVTMGAQTIVHLDPDCCDNKVEGKVIEIRAQASAETLAARRAQAPDPYQASNLEAVEDKVIIDVEEASFLENSEFLTGISGFVILPKGSTVTSNRSLNVVSEVPSHLKLQNLKEFQWSNPSAIRQLPVTEAMLAGEEDALQQIKQQIAALKTGGIAYVTTLNGNPVSLPNLGN